MPEVTLPAPVKAQFIADWPEIAPAGAFTLTVDSTGRLSSMIYSCPCGCGNQGCLRFRPLDPADPATNKASWEFNGDKDAPTLSPSVHHVGHWHGWLQQGFWKQA